MKRVRLLRLVLQRSGVQKMLAFFIAVFLLSALVVQIAEPNVNTYGDAMWFLWAVSITVGLGDFTAVTAVGRVATVICSFVAVLTTAVVTGVIVDFFNEERQHQFGNSLVDFLDKLERLPELDHEELVDISEKVKRHRLGDRIRQKKENL